MTCYDLTPYGGMGRFTRFVFSQVFQKVHERRLDQKAHLAHVKRDMGTTLFTNCGLEQEGSAHCGPQAKSNPLAVFAQPVIEEWFLYL